MWRKVAQLCLTLCDPMWPHGILQARILEWVAFPFSRRSSQPRDRTQVSRIAGEFFTSWATSIQCSSWYNRHLNYIHPFLSSLVHWFPRCLCSILPSLNNVQFTLIHGPNIPGFYQYYSLLHHTLFFTTRHIHSWSPSCITALSWQKGLCNSMNFWATPSRDTQDRWVIRKSSDKMWSTGEGKGSPLQYSCLENPMDSMKTQKDMRMEDKVPELDGVQYATGEEWRAITNRSRKKEVTGPKREWCTAVNMSGGLSKVTWEDWLIKAFYLFIYFLYLEASYFTLL